MKVSDDCDDIFEKVSDDAKDILEKISDDCDDIFEKVKVSTRELEFDAVALWACFNHLN